LAIVVGPLHSSEARGAVGGLVYNTHRGRAYVKANTAPSTQYSDDQVAMRARMSPIISAWQALSDTQRASWDHYANQHLLPSWTGTDKRISGFNWFCKINFRRSLLASGILEYPPDVNPGILLDPSAAQSAPLTILASWDISAIPDADQWSLLVFLSGPHSAARHPQLNMAKYQFPALVSDEGSVIPVTDVGTYSVFLVPVHSTGVPAPLCSCRATVT
jgi:hypothetical protein